MADFLETFNEGKIHSSFLGGKKDKNFLVLNRNFLKGIKDEMEETGQRLKCCPEDEEWKKRQVQRLASSVLSQPCF